MNRIWRVKDNVSCLVTCHKPPSLEMIRVFHGPISEKARRKHVLIESIFRFFLAEPTFLGFSAELRLDFATKGVPFDIISLQR